MDTPGDYIFNVDSASSYYLIRYEIEYEYLDMPLTVGDKVLTTKSIEPVGFTLTDSIMDSIRNRQFIPTSRFAFDYWFKYPQTMPYKLTIDKKGKTKRIYPYIVRSIEHISEYEPRKKSDRP